MNPHDDKSADDERDEERRLAKLLSAADKDAPPPDRDFLDRLREKSTQAFVDQHRPTSTPAPTVPQSATPERKEKIMFPRYVRQLVAVAAMVVIAMGVISYISHSSGPAFATVLDNVARTDSIHLKLTQQGKTGELWATQSKLRWNETDGATKIGDRDRLWQIDAKAKRKTPQHSTYFREQAGLDLLAFLDLPQRERQKLLQARPVGRVEHNGLLCNVYRIQLDGGDGPVRIEAFVDVGDQLLRALQADVIHGGQRVSLADLTVLAYNEPIDEDKFVVQDGLSEDGRLGKVIDAQGLVAIKPVLHERWTPILGAVPLRPGDWLRTDIRGGNAVAVRLDKQAGLILGPGSLVELIDSKQLRLFSGEVEITAPEKKSLELLGPLQQKVVVEGRQHYRLDKDKLVKVAKEPLWLKGFKGATANESLGSLIANVDGRNVPLTVGYHKVTVDIRDQIARTVIEESFVNRTDGVLEGVFHFPLPQDASISGFGMWIGDQLVEADVVEKQRAREIYETILREKRDPGLLEWSGGNIFKARVYPIFAHSEKRIKITYTQVLPLRGQRYTYSYALQSEMLKQHPLRDLSIDVKINSATPLKNIECPTHGTRNDRTAHSAHVEFHAQEYTPERDFELTIDVDGKQAELVLIPHRRGDDGYFILQLNPGADAPRPTEDRALLPNGAPVNVLILVDTSASIDAGQRANQAAFLGAILTALTPKDTFNVAGCDVDCDWVFEKPLKADEKNINSARGFLAQRHSLGWTNLDKAFASAFKQAGANTHIIYLGDGIVAAPPWQTGSGGGADPVGFAKRLRKLYQDAGKGTVHAVALGSSYESGALKAMASLGGGSVRRLGGTTTPQAVALELLSEIAKPALRDVKVEFKGLRTARVYPEELPNIPAGTQQIILGRYLPEGKDQTGEIIVSGSLDGKPVRYSAPVSLKDAESGNSFIPRLWARMHLDVLLEQGASEAIRDEIIALSEEYNIITPYTSLLVLESDADRERFKVKRRFQMRDGERFFAEGRDNANYELRQKQMKKAGTWRVGLRRSVLQQLSTLGRNPNALQVYRDEGTIYLGGLAGRSGATRWFEMAEGGGRLSTLGGFGFAGGMGNESLAANMPAQPLSESAPEPAVVMDAMGRDHPGPGEVPADFAESPAEGDEGRADHPAKEMASDKRELHLLSELQVAERSHVPRLNATFSGDLDFPIASGTTPVGGPAPFYRLEAKSRGWGYFANQEYMGDVPFQHVRWMDTYFPQLARPQERKGEPKSTWPADARAIARSLLRTEQLAKLTGGLAIERRQESFEPRWGELNQKSRRIELYSPRSWLTRGEGDGTQVLIDFCDGKDRGVWSKPFQLGRVRKSVADDLEPPLQLQDSSLHALDQSYTGYTVKIEEAGQARKLLRITHPQNPRHETRITIDTDKHVIVSIEQRHDNKTTGLTKFEDFIEVAGSWWAQRIQVTNDKDKVVQTITQRIETLDADAFARRMEAESAGRLAALFVKLPLPKLAEAKKALAADKTTLEDRLVLLLNFARSQQWTRTQEHLEKLEELAKGKPGVRWLRDAFLLISRRHEELRKRLNDEATRLAKDADKDNEDRFVLAEHLITQAASVVQADELLKLLDRVRPIYEKQPAHLLATKRWLQQRVNYTSQPDEGLRLQKQLATDYPRDYMVQYHYVQRLAGMGEYPAAYAWITGALAAKDAQWLPYEEETLRNLYTQYLDQQGRVSELADYLAEWIKRNPETQNAYQQYLSALVRLDQVEKAHGLMAQWLREGQVAKPEPAVTARLQAAILLMLGQGHNLNTNRLEERWLKPLADAILFLARDDERLSIAENVMNQHLFTQTDECRRVRTTITSILSKELPQLTAAQIQHYVRWIMPDDPAVPAQTWKDIAAALKQRWKDEQNAETRHQLGQALVQVLSQRAEAEVYLAFLRQQWKEGPETYRTQYANQLFDALLAQPWSAEHEDEAIALLDNLSDADSVRDRLSAELFALYRLTDAMVQARFQARMKEVKEQEKLTRIELRKKREENLRLAREGFSDRLKKEAAARKDSVLGQWLRIERLFLEMQIERDLKAVATECIEFLGQGPRKIEVDEDTPYRFEEILRERYLLTLANVSARKAKEAPAWGDHLLKYLDRGIAEDADDPRWKAFKYQALVALDRARELEQTLQGWLKGGDADSRWQLALGFLLAEQGRIDEAIKLFESIQNKDELGPIAYRSLADWYMVVNKREQHERATIASFKTMEEWRLSQMINIKLNPWQRGDGHLPSELDKDVLMMFAALFEKSPHPQNYLGQLSTFYQACRDFRLLAGLADAVVGHSAGKVYPFLQGMQHVLHEVRDEATADEMFAAIDKARAKAKTNVDKRALDLLELLVRRRAAELKNQPGPHVEAALAAMQRAFQRDWTEGEPRLMGDLLAGLGTITAEPLAKEQLRQVEALRRMQKQGTFDRLHLSHRYAQLLSGYNRKNEAVDILQAELNDFRQANDGVLPSTGNEALTTLQLLLQELRHYARGEKLFFELLKNPFPQQQNLWLTQQLYYLYHHALQHQGEVTLGKGPALYQALQKKIIGDLGTTDNNHRYALIDLLCNIYRTAHAQKIEGLRDDLINFASKKLPEVLKQQTNNYDAIVGQVSRTIHDLLGPREGISFLLDRIEQEPGWFRFNNQDGWSRHGHTLAVWRTEAKDLGDLEPRLLRLTLAELRRDLESRQQRNRAMYHMQIGHFWAEKVDDFARIAEEVHDKRKGSGAAVQYIADYLYYGLGRHARAIDIMFAAHKQKLLNENGQYVLVNYLHHQSRYEESIALLRPLIERRPDAIHYRVSLMTAYHRTGKRDQLVALLKETDAFFHQKDRWNEHVLATLAATCLSTELLNESVAYYNELIPLHQRTHPGRGIGNGTLSNYYASLALAYAGLKKTFEAVEAANGAIVSWGPSHHNRGQALESLKQVLRQSPNLDAYVAQLDKQALETGLHSPIVRKAIGQVYLEMGKYPRALTQLQLALSVQPNDLETHQALLACFDKQNDKEGAIKQLLETIQLQRRDIKLFQDLGQRYEAFQQPKEVERAYTAIVEMLPGESESHALLAEIRQRQDRWSEAAAHWEQVSLIRALEPTGLEKLAEAQIHLREWDKAADTVKKLRGKSWPTRFSEVPEQIRTLEDRIEKGRKN